MDFVASRTDGMDIYLGLGSNLGDRRANLRRALEALPAQGLAVVRVSPVVESPAMLPDAAPSDWNRPFLNLVAECSSELGPHAALDAFKRIERALGRVDAERWAPRPIDLDLLLFGREVLEDRRLRIPHPGLLERAFVVTPLAALAPELTIPGRGPRTVLEHSRATGVHLPLWMGIVNLTPDSFSDGGELEDAVAIGERVEALAAAGAQLVDVGAESTRPGATPLTADQEWARLEAPLAALLARWARDPLKPRFSVDTYHAANARRALALGVDAINDVGGLTSPAMLEVAADSSAEWIAMHNLGLPADKARTLPNDEEPTSAVARWLETRLAEWQRAGVDARRVLFDPGIGFGKTALQSLRLLRGIGHFHRYGLRLVVGHSRKSFMHQATAPDRLDRDLFTVGASLKLAAAGTDVLRVHDVAAHVAAYRGWAHVA
jgi:2-amino-4-hydroxy-6-hydroxymethyldihydropteridine diphosphokinase / dihydropteroate synthase